MIMKIICWCWFNCWILDHVCSFCSFFKIKSRLVDLSTFALKCERVRFLQDFIVWPKCPQTETAQTETARSKRPDRKVAYPTWKATVDACNRIDYVAHDWHRLDKLATFIQRCCASFYSAKRLFFRRCKIFVVGLVNVVSIEENAMATKTDNAVVKVE